VNPNHQSSIINHQSSISSGFTLLELLISLSIVGLILLIVFGALRIGSRAWEKGERDVEAHQRQRIVLGLIKQQLASASLLEIKDRGPEAVFISKAMTALWRLYHVCPFCRITGLAWRMFNTWSKRRTRATGSV